MIAGIKVKNRFYIAGYLGSTEKAANAQSRNRAPSRAVFELEAVSGLPNEIKAVACGDTMVAAITDTGRLYTWGVNAFSTAIV